MEYALEKREGNLRFSHMRIRTYAESVAFFGGETQERTTVDKVSILRKNTFSTFTYDSVLLLLANRTSRQSKFEALQPPFKPGNRSRYFGLRSCDYSLRQYVYF